MHTENLSRTPSPEKSRELLAWLRTLIADIHVRIADHSQVLGFGPDGPATLLDGSADERREPAATDETASAPTEEMIQAFRDLENELAGARLEIEQQREIIESYVQLARTDPLTGLRNRRAFEEELAARGAQWRRHGVPFALALLDLDHFKQVNDRHGHPAGDAALRWTAGTLGPVMRAADVVARVGGEEFAIVLPDTGLLDAQVPAVRACMAISEAPFVFGDELIPLRVSVGLAAATAEDDPQRLIARADEALYAAKHAGRNCVFRHDGTGCVPVDMPEESDVPVSKAPFATAASNRA